jgi:hypothetical protein
MFTLPAVILTAPADAAGMLMSYVDVPAGAGVAAVGAGVVMAGGVLLAVEATAGLSEPPPPQADSTPASTMTKQGFDIVNSFCE